MTMTAEEKTSETTDDTTSPASVQKETAKQPGRMRRAWRRWSDKADAADRERKAKRGSGSSGVDVVAGLVSIALHALVLLLDYLIAVVTATTVIPALGAWLHEQSGASQGQLTEAGTFALWAMPLLFMTALLVCAEFVLMRGMWRGASRIAAKVAALRGKGPELHEPSPSMGKAVNVTKNKKKKGSK